jgi:hypothetical protein
MRRRWPKSRRRRRDDALIELVLETLASVTRQRDAAQTRAEGAEYRERVMAEMLDEEGMLLPPPY